MTNKFIVPIPHQVDVKEVKKIIGYASENIESFEIRDNNIYVCVSGNADCNEISANLSYLLDCYMSVEDKEKIIFNQERISEDYISSADIYRSGLVKTSGAGLLNFNKEAVALFDYFDNLFLSFAKLLGCEEKKYPVLLPIDAYRSTGYLKTSPQYAIFCCELEENIQKIKGVGSITSLLKLLKEPINALSPSACFHVYDDIKDSELKSPVAITLKQNVFRNEGRFNFKEFGRLKSYTVREIVFIGNSDYVTEKLNKMRNIIIEFLQAINLSSYIISSSDAFIVPEIQKIKDIQITEKSKYEVKIKVDSENSLACASLNYHGISFSKPFHFNVFGAKNTVSGCIGFGLERWILAFLSQFGCELKNWPSEIKDTIKPRRD